MSETRHDAWQAGDRYENYMGRWSRLIAPRFLEWLGAGTGRDWLDVGCGTGALSAAIVSGCDPKSVVGVDASAGFVAAAREMLPDARAAFQVGNATALPLETASRDAAVSGLMLNFVPERGEALAEMGRVARPGGQVGFYVWDYPGGGMGLMRAFWEAATALDPAAGDLSEDRRFPFCTPEALASLAEAAGLREVASTTIDVQTVFRDFDDYWRPFTLGTGPAPGYCASLDEDAREGLRTRLSDSLPRGADGSVSLPARAWAIKGRTAL
jgi:SAM-dependent methyltransferase